MRSLRVLVSGVLLVSLLGARCSTSGKGSVSAAPATETALALTSKTVALVRTDEDTDTTRPYCSGVWVRPKTILTAAHCVEKSPLAALLGVDENYRYATREDVFVNGSPVEARYPATRVAVVVAQDEEHDIALLEAVGKVPDHRVAEVGPNPEQGQHVETMGHSKGLWWSYSSGDVAAIRLAPIGSEPMLWVQTTAPISPGNSGGGLFDEKGRLVGIASRQMAHARLQNLNFFVHPHYVRALLAGPKP